MIFSGQQQQRVCVCGLWSVVCGLWSVVCFLKLNRGRPASLLLCWALAGLLAGGHTHTRTFLKHGKCQDGEKFKMLVYTHFYNISQQQQQQIENPATYPLSFCRSNSSSSSSSSSSRYGVHAVRSSSSSSSSSSGGGAYHIAAAVSTNENFVRLSSPLPRAAGAPCITHLSKIKQTTLKLVGELSVEMCQSVM